MAKSKRERELDAEISESSAEQRESILSKSKTSPEEADAIEEEMYQNYKNDVEELANMSPEKKDSKGGQDLIFRLNDMDEDIRAAYQERMSKENMAERKGSARGGSQLLVPVEMQDELPSRDLPDEDLVAEDMLEVSQEPDPVMEDQYVDFVLTQSLNPDEQDYLMGALEADPRLSEIFDKVVETASEFTGDGPVEGPGTGVSDSIPARLSDGEFVMTKEATDEIGPDNLERLMHDAENGEIRRTSYGGGLQEYAFGGLTRDTERSLLEDDEEEIKKQMINANRMPSVV
jgi:hypothetical protein